jgi:hypothetical protein
MSLPDLSALHGSVFSQLLAAPTAGTPAFIAFALSCSILFSLAYTLIAFRHKMGEKLSATLNKPPVQQITAWIGFFGFFIG